MSFFDKLASSEARARQVFSFDRAREAYRGSLATEGIFDMFRGTEDGTYTDFHGDFKKVREDLIASEGKELQDNAKTVKLGAHAVVMSVEWNKPIDSAEEVMRQLERAGQMMTDLTKYYVPAMTELYNRVVKEVGVPMSQLAADSQDPKLVERFEAAHKASAVEGMRHWMSETRWDHTADKACRASPNFLGLWYLSDTLSGMPNLTPFRVSTDFMPDEHIRSAKGYLAQSSDALVKPYSRVEVITVLEALEKTVAARRELHVALEKMMALRSTMNEAGHKFIHTFPHWQEKQSEWPAQTVYSILTTEDQLCDYDGSRAKMLAQIDRAMHVVVKVCEISLKRMG